MASIDEAMGTAMCREVFRQLNRLSTLSVARFDKPLVMAERGKI